MTNLTSTLKSTAAAIDLSDFGDVLGQLNDAPDVPSAQLRYVQHAQPMSHSLQEQNIDKYIPGLAVGNYAVPNLDGGYQLFTGTIGIRYLVAMMRQIHVKHLHDKTTEVLPKLVNRDLLERVTDPATGFKISILRDTKEHIETQWLAHGLFEGMYPATRRYKGSNYKAGQMVNNIVSSSFLGPKYFPMLTLFHEMSRYVAGKEGPRYEADIKVLGKMDQLNGPPREWVHQAALLRASLLNGTPYAAVEPQAIEPPAPPPAPAVESKPAAPAPASDIRSGAAWDSGRGEPYGGPRSRDEIEDADYGF